MSLLPKVGGEVLAELGVAVAGGGEGDDFGGVVRKFEDGADDGADAVFSGGGVGSGGAGEAESVGDGDGGIVECGGACDHVLREAGAVEEGEGGSGVEFGKQSAKF